MADVLSQSEVESLLAALDPESQAAGQGGLDRRGDLHSQIAVYDFKRPERVSKEQIRAFQALHDGFSREFGVALSGMLRTIVEVKLISVDQLTYSEFVFSLEKPTCFNLLRSEGLDGNLILDLNPSIIFPIVDRLLGGGKNAEPNLPRRPLTEIELRLVSRITKLAIAGLENAWRNVRELKLSVVQVENNPQLVQIVPPNEVIVLISFELMMGESRGIMNLCIPFNTIEVLSSKLSADSWSAYTKKAAEPRQVLNLQAGISQAKVELIVKLAGSKLSVDEFMNLGVGDVIMTETDRKEPVTVFIEGRPFFQAFPGVLKGHKAVRLGREIVKPQDIVEAELKRRSQEAGKGGGKPG